MKYIESKLNPDGNYDHTVVREAWNSGASLQYFDTGERLYIVCNFPTWSPGLKYCAQVPDAYGIHESAATLREVKGDAGPAVSEMLLDRIRELESREFRTDADRSASLIVAKLAASIPLKDTLKATSSGMTMVDYFKNSLDRIRELEEALDGIYRVLGPGIPSCVVCEGCDYEWGEALRIARAALNKEPK